MANVDRPAGFRPLGFGLNGGVFTLRPYTKLVGYATALFPGDLVNQVATGDIEASATPGTTLYTGVSNQYSPASTADTVMVVDDPAQCFEAQGDDGTSLAAADRGLNANAILGAGNATLKRSGHEIDSSTKDVTSTLDLKLIDRLKVEGNEYGEFARFVVVINKHRNAPGVAGV